MESNEYLNFAKEMCIEAGKIMKKYFYQDNGASYKGDKTIVTLADKEINHILIEKVKEKFPTHSVDGEEEKFGKTIDQGLSILSDMEKQMEADGVKVLSGENAFKLYDTYGFPMDLTQEILEEKGFSVDEEGFKKAMEVQRTTARKARKVTNYMGADETVYESVDPSVTTEFVGYDSLNCKSKITVLTTETEIVEALSDGEVGTVIVEQTPFYATMGGQQGDKGIIRTAAGEFQVEDTIKLLGGKVGHVGKMISGMMKTGDEADLSVDAALRAKICKNHSATHLLQKALREVLGTHVEQAGSYQDGERTRFDFSHFAAMTPEELEKVEKIVNDKIAEAIPVPLHHFCIFHSFFHKVIQFHKRNTDYKSDQKSNYRKDHQFRQILHIIASIHTTDRLTHGIDRIWEREKYVDIPVNCR